MMQFFRSGIENGAHCVRELRRALPGCLRGEADSQPERRQEAIRLQHQF